MTVTLRPENPFYDLFPNGMVPVRGPFPMRCDLGEAEARLCYLLDGDALSTEAMEDVARRMAELRGGRVNDILSELIEHGLPIRTSEVVCAPAFELGYVEYLI